MDTYQFQSMGVRQIFLGALRHYRVNFLKLIGIAAPGTLIGGLAFQAIWIYGYAEIGGPQVLAAALPYTAITIFQSLVVTAAGTFVVSQDLLGRSINVGKAYSRVLGSFFPLLGVLVIFMLGALVFSTIAAGIGLMVFIPVIVVYVWFCLAAPVVIIEKEGGFGALKRSRVLVKGFFQKTFILVVLLTGVQTFVDNPSRTYPLPFANSSILSSFFSLFSISLLSAFHYLSNAFKSYINDNALLRSSRSQGGL